MTWRQNQGNGWARQGFATANSIGLARRSNDVLILGASQAGGGGVQAEFEVDQDQILLLDPAGHTFPAGASMTHNGVTSTSAFHVWQNGPEKGLIRTASLAGKLLRTVTHSAPGTALSNYLSTEWTTALAEADAVSLAPGVVVYIISPTDAAGSTIVQQIPGKLHQFERQVRAKYGPDCGIVLIGTIDTDQPEYMTSRQHAREFCDSTTGLRRYIEPRWPQQVTTPHMTALGEFVCGMDVYEATRALYR
ncbi:MAG: hypothetical protein ABL912_01965 [Novosphingobium sp.]